MLPNANGAVVAIFAIMSAGRVPAMMNFTSGLMNLRSACKAADIRAIVTSRAFVEKAHLEKIIEGLGPRRDLHLSRGRAGKGGPRRQAARASRMEASAGGAQGRRPRGDPVHLGLGGHAQGRRAVEPQHARQCGTGRGAHRLRPRRQGVQRAAAVPLVRIDGRAGAAGGVRRRRLSLPLAAALPDHPGADLRDQRHHPVRHRHVPRRLCAVGALLRLPLAALRARRRRAAAGDDAPHLHGEVRAAHPRGLRRDRDRAGARAQHADVQQIRHRRPPAAGNGGAARAGAGHRGRRPPVRARSRT